MDVLTGPEPIGVGVVGLRFGTAVHVPAFQAHRACRVVALAGRDLARTQGAAAAAGVERAYDSWRDLLLDDAIDAVSIAVPPSDQPAIISHAAQRGKHVFCEKPLAANLDSAREALDCVRRASVVHAMNFIFPEVEAWRTTRELIRNGAIGATRHFSYRWWIETLSSRAATASWKRGNAEGGGVVGNFLSHVLFNVEWLLGTVVAIDSVSRRDGAEAALFSECVASLAGGVHGRISVSTAAYLGCGHEIEVFGDNGTIVLRNTTPNHHADGFEVSIGTRASGRLEVVARDPVETAVDGRIAPTRRIVGRFLDAIRRGGSVEPNLEHGVHVQQWLQQVSDAAIA